MEEARPGRTEVLELLRISDVVDEFLIPHGPHAESFQIMVTFAARSRRVARAIVLLLDEGLDIEAEMLDRVLMETVVTLQWLAFDFPLRITSWRLHDTTSRLAWDDNYAKSNGGQGVMTEAGRAEMEALQHRLEARKPERYPAFWERCEEVERQANLDPSWNVVLYKRASHGAIHPSTMALQRMIDRIDEEGGHISAYGPETIDDDYPYEWAALWLQIGLEVLGQCAPKVFPWRPEVLAIGERLRAGIQAREEDEG